MIWFHSTPSTFNSLFHTYQISKYTEINTTNDILKQRRIILTQPGPGPLKGKFSHKQHFFLRKEQRKTSIHRKIMHLMHVY